MAHNSSCLEVGVLYVGTSGFDEVIIVTNVLVANRLGLKTN